jgi:hypothetical protein
MGFDVSGKLCDVVLWNRSVTTFEKDQVIYHVGDENQTFAESPRT